MKITILTLFPDMFQGPFHASILKKAQENGFATISVKNIRDFGIGKHKIVDDKPYGGGLGMVLRVDVLERAIAQTRDTSLQKHEEKVVLLDARGVQYTQKKAFEYSKLKHLILICGHYEGVDERIKHFVDESVSIGPFILTGGEIPTMLITDSIVRLIKGVLKEGVVEQETFSKNISSLKSGLQNAYREYPQYTRPEKFLEYSVPKVLLSGNHQEILEWKKKHELFPHGESSPERVDPGV